MITNTGIISKPCKDNGESLNQNKLAPYYQIITEDEYAKVDQDWNEIRSYFPATWHWDLIDTEYYYKYINNLIIVRFLLILANMEPFY